MRLKQQSPTAHRTHSDTDRGTEVLLVELERRTPAWRKLELASSLNRMVLEFSLAGLRQRNPEANDEELKRLLADIVLGPELAARVYGTSPDAIK